MANANTSVNYPLLLMRVALGILFFYAGITKVMDPSWTAAGYLSNAQTFSDLFAWFASDANIVWVNFLNQWGLTAIGLGLLTGTFTRLASYFGILLMMLYYFPVLSFPYVGEHSFLVDDHVLEALALLIVARSADRHGWGVDTWLVDKFKWKGWWF